MKNLVLIFLSGLFLVGFKSNAQLTSVTNNPVTNITNEGATLNGNINTSSAVDVDYQFNYSSTSGNLNSSSTLVENFNVDGTESVNATLTGLDAGTQYFFQLFAERSSDNTEDQLSAEESFWTYSDVTSTAVAGFQRQTASTTSITLEWTAQATDIAGYLIVYTTGGTAPDETDLEQGIAPGALSYANKVVVADASTTSTTINSLSANAQYSFRIIPYNVGLDDATTNYKLTGNTTLSTYTLEVVTSAAIADFGLATKGTTNIELEWTAETTDNDGYLILFATGSTAPDPAAEIELGVAPGAQSFSNKIVKAGSASTSQDITGLVEGTEYSFVIIPYNTGADPSTTNYNVTTNSEVSSFTLAIQPNDNASAPVFVSSTSTSITLEFAKSDGATPADGYFITYQIGTSAPGNPGAIDGTDGSSELAEADVDGTFTIFSTMATISATITGLSPKTEYSFRIIAFSSDATNNPSSFNYKTNGITFQNKNSFTLATEPTTAVSNFVKTSATETAINFSFDSYTFADNGGFVLYYQAGSAAPDLSALKDGFDPPNQAGLSLDYGLQITDNATSISTDANISPGSEYSVTIVPYNYDGSNLETFNYRKADAVSLLSVWSLSTAASGGAVDDAGYTVNNATSNSLDVTYTAVTDADGYLILHSAGNSAFDISDVIDGQSPAQVQSALPGGVTLLDNGTALTKTIGSLNGDTEYAFYVIPYTFTDSGGPVSETYNYNTASPVLKTGTTLCDVGPTVGLASIDNDTGALTTTSVKTDLSNVPAGAENLVVARLSADALVAPSDGVTYTANSVFGSGAQTGAGNDVVLVGTGTSVTTSSLSPYTDYAFDYYVYNPNGHCYSFVETISVTTHCEPATTIATGTSTSAISFDEIKVNWTIAGAGNNVLVVARETATTAVAPTSNTDYAEDPIFGNGGTTGAGNFTVYDGNAASVTITGLAELTDYSFDIYEYNPTNGGFCYNTTAVTENATTVCQPPSTTSTFNAATNLTAGSVDLNWNTATGADSYLIVAKQGPTVDLVVNNGDDYTADANSSFADAAVISTDNKIVYANAGTSTTITGLTEGTEYTFEIYAYVNGTFCYAFGPDAQTITTLAASANNTLALNSAPLKISSVDNAGTGTYITVMDFNMTDGGVDGIATKLASFAFNPGTGNDFADWTTLIQDAKVVNVINGNEKAAASITAGEISITIASSENNGTGKFGYIDDNTSVKMQLQIRLKASIALSQIDGLNFVFQLDPTSITTQGNSSGFNTTAGSEITTAATDNEVEVIATAFEFTTDPPATVNAGENVSPQAVVEAKDANGNLDLDYGNFAISNGDNIPMDNLPAPPSFSNGEFVFPATFNYQGSGDGTLTLTDGSSLFDQSSIAITVNPTVDLTEIDGLFSGLNAGTLQSSSTDQAVLGFTVDALGTTDLTAVEFTTDQDISGLVDNLRLVVSTNTTYDDAVTDAPLPITPAITGGNTITFSGLSESFDSDSKNYFLILDVEDHVNISTPNVTFQLDINDIVFTNSANKNTSSFSKQYDFEDVTKPEVQQITAVPTVLSGADLGANALQIQVTFNEEMDPNAFFAPNISFPVEDPTTSISAGSEAWSSGNTVYTFNFELVDNDELIENIDVLITNAQDIYGNTLDDFTEADLFSIDTENPIADNVNLDIALVNRTDDTIELAVTFNKEMNDAIAPSFTVNSSNNLIANGDGVWSEAVPGEGFKVYTLTFTHDLTIEENITDKIIIEDAEDVAGNIMDIAETNPFTINTTRPRIDFITSTNTTGIYKAGDVITIEVHFDQNLTVDDGSGSPELDLNSGGIATFNNTANNIITFNYTVLATENAALLDVAGFRLEGATIKNAGLNDAILTLPADPTDELSTRKEIEIDTQSPEIASTTITPNTVSRVNPTLTLIVNYNEVMDQTSSPVFLPSDANIILQTGEWSDNQTYRAEFEHDLTVEEEVANVTIEISDATDSVGNTTVTADSETFNIDTQHPRITEIVTTTADGTYGPGEQINIRVVFDESIQQTGTAPTLTLNTGATAVFDNITGVNQDQLNFTYTIGSVNSNENTLDLDVTSISTSENEVLDLVNNPSVLTLPNSAPNRLIDFADIVIDTRPAVITNVTSTSLEPKYKAGESIEIVVTFDEVVTVSNFPRIALNTGDYADYTGGSGSNDLTFNYTVQDADGATLFDVLELEYADVNSLELNGGSILDPASVPVDQALPTIGSGNSLSDNTTIEIDTRDPEFTIDLSITMVDLNDLVLTVTTSYDEDMDVTTDPSYALSLGTNLIQDNVGNWTDNRTYVETFTHNGTEEEITGITIEISGATDEVGNTAVTNTSDPFDIDTQKPRITQITSTSTGIYGPGEVIDVKVTFDEDVQQTGTNPTLNLNSTGVATYVNITNGNEVNFSYTIGAVNSGENTADLSVDSFSTSENEVLDLQANPSVLNLPGANNLGDNADIIIDTDPADITNVTANPTSGVFKAGDQIDIIITFNETVLVDETGGTPRLLLNTGSFAEYSSGSNSNELTFTYTVASAGGSIVDVLDLEYANINSLELNGGTIVDLASVNANLILPATAGAGSLSDNTDIEIDTTSPTIVTIDLDNTLITISNNQLNVTLTYNEDMDQGTTPTFNVIGSVALVLDGGSWNSATEYVATFTHNLTEEEVQNVTIEISGGTDVVGNTSITNTSEDITIDTQRPRILEIVTTSDDGLYSPGDEINIQLVFDEDVTVGGNPTLDLNSGAAAIAVFDNVSGNEVNFIYTVGGVNSDENTLDLDVTAFNINGGNIRDLVSNDALIILPSEPDRLQDNAEIQIDSDPADIVNVAATPSIGFFKAGDQIDITIAFDEPVVVTGTPLLSLNTGSNAEYVSGSNSTVLTFNYTVETSNGTTIVDVPELDYAGVGSILLNGGSIEDLAGISGNLGLPAPGSPNSLNGNTEITIDTEAPELANDPFTPFNGEFNVSHSLTFTIEMNEPVSGQGTNNITIIDKKTSSVLVVLDGANAFTNNTSNSLEFDSFENLLQDSTEYYIQFEPGALVDRAGNPFSGFTADNIWAFTTFGPPRIDDFSIGACVGELFTIQGQYFTGVSRIRTNIDGDTPFTITSFTIVDDETIEFTVPAGTVPGRITLDKQLGQEGNTANASTTSNGQIKVGPSSAQLVLVDANDVAICDVDDQGNENEVEFSVTIVGGNGVYTLVYQVNANDPVTITGFERDQTFSIVPPDSAQNNVRILSLTDEDEDLNTCSAPNLGTEIEVVKYIRSRVDAGGFSENEDDIGVIELCGANSNIVDFSDDGVVVNRPKINGTIEQGIWTIDEGPSANGGGFSPDFSLKSVQTDRPDTVKYYASFADGVRGSVVLKLTSDDPGGLNPCSGTFDLVSVQFVESISVLTERNLSLCLEEDENGNQFAIADLTSSVSGGVATDSLTVNWIRVDEFSEETDYDSTWGFKDDENQAKYALSSKVLNPIYKASPLEIQEGRATLQAAPELVSGVGCGATNTSREVSIRINNIPDPTKSSGPEIVCSGDQEVRFRMNPTRTSNTFQWSFTNGENEFDGATNSNLVFVNFREVETETIDTLVVQEFNPSTGCISKPDTFFISLKPLPIANIKYNSTTTISNTAELIPLIGEGGTPGNLVDATPENGQFTGDGVIKSSNGNYFLDSSQLGVTDITNEEDVHEVIFTFFNEFGCSATDTIAFNVFDAERIFTGLNEAYCLEDPAFTIKVDPAIVPDGFEVSDITGPGISNVIFDETTQELTATFDPETAYRENGDQSSIFINYSIVDPNNPANNAENIGQQLVIVNPLPELEIEPIETNLCSYDENLEFEPIGNIGTNYSFTLLNEDISDTLMLGNSTDGFEFNLGPLDEYLINENKDSIEIRVEYTLTNQNTCTDSRTYSFVVWRRPTQPILESTELCIIEGEIDTAEVINYDGGDGNAEDELIWLAEPNFTTDTDLYLETGATFVPSENLFTSDSRKFYVFRINENSSGEEDPSCVSEPTEVTYRRINSPTFTWDKSTFGDEDIIFTGVHNQTELDTTLWTITKIEVGEDTPVLQEDITPIIDNDNDSTAAIAVNFNNYGAGRYRVSFNVSTRTSCSVEVTDEILILPEAEVSEIYIYDFDGSTQGWVSDGLKLEPEVDDTLNRVWDFAVPSGDSKFQSNEPIWITNAEGSYESGIDSYVYSPAIDISNISRPVVSFDLWTNMAEQNDGLILEYSTDDKRIEDNTKVWQLLGGVSSGLQWYDNSEIESLSGIANNTFGVGWSVENDSESISSVNAKHTLEGIENNVRVIFRFRFKSEERENEFGNRDGAAFDNFRIESLNRNVLIEYFGDFVVNGNPNANDVAEMNAINEEFNTSGNFAWINYRIDPNDPLYKLQSSSMLSRVYYYDAYELANQYAIDGEIRTETTFSQDDGGANDLSRARLFSTIISRIDLDVSLVNENELGIEVSFESVEPLDDNVNLYIAVLQKEISGGAQGTNPNVTYYNILRKLLPGNSGIAVSGISGEHSVKFKAERLSDEEPLAVVAFLQNVDNGEVIQSAYIDGFPQLTYTNVTSVDKALSALDIKLYPNPAHDNLNIYWDIPLQEEAKAKVIDITGKIIKDFRLEKGQRFYELNTSSMKTGMYNLILTNQKGEHKMMKFAVTN